MIAEAKCTGVLPLLRFAFARRAIPLTLLAMGLSGASLGCIAQASETAAETASDEDAAREHSSAIETRDDPSGNVTALHKVDGVERKVAPSSTGSKTSSTANSAAPADSTSGTTVSPVAEPQPSPWKPSADTAPADEPSDPGDPSDQGTPSPGATPQPSPWEGHSPPPVTPEERLANTLASATNP